MEELWKEIPNYEGLYEVSNLGRVRAMRREFTDKNGRNSAVPERILKIDDRQAVNLIRNNKSASYPVRSLVAQSFLGLPLGSTVSHIDRDITNAAVSNLTVPEAFRLLDPNWRDIPGWEGYYQASRFGEIRSIDRNIKMKSGIWRYCPGVVRTQESAPDGYLQIALYQDGNRIETRHVHRFIAQAWIPNPENKPTVNHIDGNKHNNCIENLEWATYVEQQEHVARIGLRKKPYWSLETNGPVGGDWNEKRQIKVRCIETKEEYPSLTAAGEAHNASASDIKMSVDHHKSCRGLHFVKADEPDYKFGVEDLEGEEWRPIPGFETRYCVSNKRRVKSVERVVKSGSNSTRIAPEKLISLKYGFTLTDENGNHHSMDMDQLQHEVFGTPLYAKAKKLFNISE